MKKILLVVGVLGFTMAITSCGEKAEATTESNQTEQVQGVKQARVEKAEFVQFMKDHPDAQLIDIRTPGEFAGGHIENAVNIDFYGKDFTAKLEKLDKTKPVLIYCKSGGRSGKALGQMKKMEFGTILELKGGYSHW